MSYSIEYNRRMYVVPSANGKPSYLLLIKSGDNNVFSRQTGLRARDWHLGFFGEESGYWPYIGGRGGYCEGGGLQRSKGWNETVRMSIEQYLSIYRKVFRTANPIANIFSSFELSLWVELRGSEDTRMTLEDVKLPKRKESISSFITSRSMTFKASQNYYGQKTSEVTVPIVETESLIHAIGLRGSLSSSVEGFGGSVILCCEEKGKGR